MFEQSPFIWTCLMLSYHQGISNKCFCSLEGTYMKNDISKDFVIEMVKKVDDSDKKFLLQVYTIIKRHLDKKGRR